MNTVFRSSARAMSSIVSSGSRPSSAAIAAMLRCSWRARSGRAVSTTWTLSHSLLKRRNVVAVFSSARTPSRNARSASTAFELGARPSERRLPARQTFDGIGRRQGEIHRQRAARDLAEQAMAARVGGGDRVEVVEHRARRHAVVEQRRDHHRPAGRGRERLEERDLGVPAFGQHVDAAAAFAHRADERRHLGIARQPRRHRQAAFAVVRRARAAGEADGAVRHRVANDRLHLRDLGGARLAPRRVVAHHVGSHRGMADVGGDVGDAAARAQLRHVLAEGLEAPVDAGAQRVDRHAFDLGEVPHRQLAIGGPARRDREAAVADHRRRHAERGRGRQRRIPGDLRVEVGVAVDDAGHQREPVGGDRPRGVDVEPRADGDDPAAVDRDVASVRLAAATVDDERVAKDEVDHAVFRRGAAKSDFHLAPRLVRRRRGVHRHVGPRQALPLLHRSHDLDVVGQAERQAADARRRLGGQQLAPDRVAAFAVEQLAGLQVALGGGDDVGVPAGGDAGRLAAQGDARDRHADLEADQVPALVEREVAPARVGVGVVFLEAVADVLGLALDRDPHAHADVVRDLAAVRFERRDDLDHALSFEHAAFRDRPRHERDVLDARRRIEQAVARHRQAGRVGDGGRFDRRLGAVEEAVEHLRVEAAALGLLGREAVVAPHGLGRRFAEVRQPLVAAPGGGDREAAGSRPVDQVADQRRLVAEGERVDDAGLGRLPRQQRPAERIGLDRDVDDVLAVRIREQAVLDGRDRMAGALDDDVDGRMRDQRLPVLADVRRARLDGAVEARGAGLRVAPADAREVATRAVGREVGDADQVNARRARNLRQVHRAELAGADEADADRLAVGLAPLQLCVQAHRETSALRAAAFALGAARRLMPRSSVRRSRSRARSPACRSSTAARPDSSSAGSRPAGNRSA